jgi:hypothetical protein
VVDGDDRNPVLYRELLSYSVLDVSDSWHWCLLISVDFLQLRVVRICGIQ